MQAVMLPACVLGMEDDLSTLRLSTLRLSSLRRCPTNGLRIAPALMSDSNAEFDPIDLKEVATVAGHTVLTFR